MKKTLIVIISIFFCVTSLSYAQNINWNLTGAGARAAGFGGAFIGVADDATAISWNPAGLTQLIDPEFSAVMRYINDSYKYVERDEDNTISIGHFTPNFVSAVYPFDFGGHNIVAGIAYQQMLDFYSEGVDYYGDDYKTTGGVFNMSLGLGVQIIPVFSVGVTSNVWTGNYKYEVISKGDGENFSGFNFNLGAMLNLDNLNSPIPVKIGFGFKSPFDLNSDFDYTVQMPTMIGVGGSVRLGDNLTVACDYETRAYGSSKIVYDDGGDAPLSYYDLNQLRVGAEYLLVTDFAVIPLRVGFHTFPTTFSNYENYPDGRIDQVVGSGFAVGTGLIFEKIAIDATVTMDSFKEDLIKSVGKYTELSTTTFTLSGILYLN